MLTRFSSLITSLHLSLIFLTFLGGTHLFFFNALGSGPSQKFGYSDLCILSPTESLVGIFFAAGAAGGAAICTAVAAVAVAVGAVSVLINRRHWILRSAKRGIAARVHVAVADILRWDVSCEELHSVVEIPYW